LFTRQAIPMMWDFAENDVLGEAAGAYTVSLGNMAKALEQAPASQRAFAVQSDAQTQSISQAKVVSTDPPYYDNVPYADLSDFFYIWLRQWIGGIYPDLFNTLLTPKADELVAEPFRHGGSDQAKKFFEVGLGRAFDRLRLAQHPDY